MENIKAYNAGSLAVTKLFQLKDALLRHKAQGTNAVKSFVQGAKEAYDKNKKQS